MSAEALAERIRLLLAGPGISEKKMFGGTCFLLNDHMLAGTSKGKLLVRVGKDNHVASISRPQAQTMDVGGRKIDGYVYVAPDGIKTNAALTGWLDLARSYVATLPPKERKAPKPKRR